MKKHYLFLLLAIGCLILAGMEYKKQRDRNILLFGSNPATFRFETNRGGSGTMRVRDADKAEEEILAENKADLEWIKKDKRFKIEGDISDIKVTKLERID